MSVSLLLQIEGSNRVHATYDPTTSIKDLKTNLSVEGRLYTMPENYKVYTKGRLVQDETQSLGSVLSESFQIVELRLDERDREAMNFLRTKTLTEMEAFQKILSDCIEYQRKNRLVRGIVEIVVYDSPPMVPTVEDGKDVKPLASEQQQQRLLTPSVTENVDPPLRIVLHEEKRDDPGDKKKIIKKRVTTKKKLVTSKTPTSPTTSETGTPTPSP